MQGDGASGTGNNAATVPKPNVVGNGSLTDNNACYPCGDAVQWQGAWSESPMMGSLEMAKQGCRSAANRAPVAISNRFSVLSGNEPEDEEEFPTLNQSMHQGASIKDQASSFTHKP